MTLNEFILKPVSRHAIYDDSFLNNTAPHHTTGEILLGAAYRKLVLGMLDTGVDLENIASVATNVPASISPILWENLVYGKGGIRGPEKGGQQKAPPQLMPIVPAIARFACVLGKGKKSRWEPSKILYETLGAGLGPIQGSQLAQTFAEALKVGQDDDLFARFLETAVSDSVHQAKISVSTIPNIPLEENDARAFRKPNINNSRTPSERFCSDLKAIIALKDQLTRRQWTVLIETIMRIGLGMHVLWVCQINWLVWQIVLDVAAGKPVPTISELENQLWESHREQRPLLEIGLPAVVLLERILEYYSYARLGLNMLLCRLEDCGVPWNGGIIGLSAASSNGPIDQLHGFLIHISHNLTTIDPVDASVWLQSNLSKLFDDNPNLRKGVQKSSLTKNMFYFARHSLGQIVAKDPALKSYDQSYLFAQLGGRSLEVQLGPTMLITLVHACCASLNGVPASLDDFRQHLADYGIHAPAGELVEGKTGDALEKLGLVVDSPDAAGGRLLVPPFKL